MAVTIDGVRVEVPAGGTVLAAAQQAGVYIPTLCWHPDLTNGPASAARVRQGEVDCQGAPGQPFLGCDLCVVELAGRDEPVHACWVTTEEEAVVTTDSPRLRERRRAAFARVMAEHPRSCLSCRQKAGCAREPCSLNVPVNERCCTKLGRCAIEKLYDWLEFSAPLPPYVRDRRRVSRTAFLAYDWNLCVDCNRCVRVCSGTRQVGALGFVLDQGRARAGFVDEAACRYCGACAEVCPTGAILDREPHEIPCHEACPAGLDVPAYVRAVAQGRPEIAARIVRNALPFGRVLGRICHAPCQAACHRALLTDPIAICAIKRFACDRTPPDLPARAPATGHQVAVIGAGPAGLAAAWFLARKGHAVTVFEAQAEAGGMLRWGIPEFRLDADVVRSEVEEIAALGVEIRTGTRVDDPAALRAGHAAVLVAAVLVAAGLPRSRRLGVEGIDLYGVEFLRAARSGTPDRPGARTVVIGGGNVAVDCALTARRLGATEVTLVCLEAEGRMPAFPWELEHARAEGIEVRNGWGPVAVRAGAGGKVLTCRRCLSVFDAQGRFAPTFADALRIELAADTVIAAIGQQAEDRFRPRRDPTAGVYLAGDGAGGPFSVVGAIASGKAAAAEIDRQLGGTGELPALDLPAPSPAIGRIDGFAGLRAVVPAAGEAGGFTADEAMREAMRCLQCDLRFTLRAAPQPPEREPRLALTEAVVATVPAEEGVLEVYAADGQVLAILGVVNLRAEAEKLITHDKARAFRYELDPYYTKRESEHLQAHLQRHGAMPPGLEDMDDLF